MARLVMEIPDEVAAIFKYHLTKVHKQSGKYMANLIIEDLKKQQPDLMKVIDLEKEK